MPTQAGVPEVDEKIAILSGFSEVDVQSHDPVLELTDVGIVELTPSESDMIPPERDTLAGDGNGKSFDIIGETRIRLARKFMIEEGDDFQWLLRRLKIAAGLMTTGSTETIIRDELVELVGSNREFTLDLDWDPVEFMNEQYTLYKATKCRLQEVICLCGAGDQVQALSCEGYASKMWPHLGPMLLDITSQAMEAAIGTYKGGIYCTLSDRSIC